MLIPLTMIPLTPPALPTTILALATARAVVKNIVAVCAPPSLGASRPFSPRLAGRELKRGALGRRLQF
jgi:hypothetical protein